MPLTALTALTDLPGATPPAGLPDPATLARLAGEFFSAWPGAPQPPVPTAAGTLPLPATGGVPVPALLREGQGSAADARALRDQAFEQAPAAGGTLNGQRFEWVADADMRLGPVLEVNINGKYYWVPFARLAKLTVEEPEDLRDAVWMPAHLQFENGGETVGLIPTRYPGSEASSDGLIALSRKTEWQEPSEGFYVGLGQRVLTMDTGDVSLMDVRTVEWDALPPSEAVEEAGDE